MMDSIFIFWLIIMVFFIMVSSLTHFFSILVFVELLWMLFYFYALVNSINLDNLLVLSFIFLVLIFSAAETSMGFMLFNYSQNCKGTDLFISLDLWRNQTSWVKNIYTSK